MLLAVTADTFTDPWTTASSVVVLQHGFCRNHRFWDGWVPYLARRHRVLRPDLPGCGDSQDVSAAEMDLADLAGVLASTLRAHADGPVHYVGESLGGLLGVYLAATEPQLVASLSLISTPLWIDSVVTSSQSLGEPSWADAVRKLGLRRWWIESRARMRGAAELAAPSPSDEWAREQAAMVSPDAAVRLVEIIEASDVRELARDVKQPVRILVPERSRYANRPDQLGYYGHFANASVDVIPGTNHEMYTESCDRIAPVIAGFIDDVGAEGDDGHD